MEFDPSPYRNIAERIKTGRRRTPAPLAAAAPPTPPPNPPLKLKLKVAPREKAPTPQPAEASRSGSPARSKRKAPRESTKRPSAKRPRVKPPPVKAAEDVLVSAGSNPVGLPNGVVDDGVFDIGALTVQSSRRSSLRRGSKQSDVALRTSVQPAVALPAIAGHDSSRATVVHETSAELAPPAGDAALPLSDKVDTAPGASHDQINLTERTSDVPEPPTPATPPAQTLEDSPVDLTSTPSKPHRAPTELEDSQFSSAQQPVGLSVNPPVSFNYFDGVTNTFGSEATPCAPTILPPSTGLRTLPQRAIFMPDPLSLLFQPYIPLEGSASSLSAQDSIPPTPPTDKSRSAEVETNDAVSSPPREGEPDLSLPATANATPSNEPDLQQRPGKHEVLTDKDGLLVLQATSGGAMESPEVEPLSLPSSPKAMAFTGPSPPHVVEADASTPPDAAIQSHAIDSPPQAAKSAPTPCQAGDTPGGFQSLQTPLPEQDFSEPPKGEAMHHIFRVFHGSATKPSPGKPVVFKHRTLAPASKPRMIPETSTSISQFEMYIPQPTFGPQAPSTPPSPGRQLIPCIPYMARVPQTPETLSPPFSQETVEFASSEDVEFIRRMKAYARERQGGNDGSIATNQGKRILDLLEFGRPASGAEMMILTEEEAAANVARNMFTSCPILTSGQQKFPLQTPQQFLDELYDEDATVHIQDPTIKPATGGATVREITIRELKQRFSEPTPGAKAWNCLELATHVDDGLRPAFLNNEDCRLLTKLKHPSSKDKVGRQSYAPGWKEVEKWALLAQGGALTEPHQDSHGYSTYITVNHGTLGFGWLSDPSANERRLWNQAPSQFSGTDGKWRYVVLRPGQTVYFPAGTVHFVFRLPEEGHTLAFGGHVLRCSQIVRWVKTLIDEKQRPCITNEDMTESALGYLRRVEKFVRQALSRGDTERWGGTASCEEFLRLRQAFSKAKKGR